MATHGHVEVFDEDFVVDVEEGKDGRPSDLAGWVMARRGLQPTKSIHEAVILPQAILREQVHPVREAQRPAWGHQPHKLSKEQLKKIVRESFLLSFG